MLVVRLAIDYGTSNTVAVLRWPDGRTQQLLFDASPLLPSAVQLGPGGQLLTGQDAVRGARSGPDRYEPTPKRRVGEAELLLGGVGVPVGDAIAATLRRVAEEAARAAGQRVTSVVLTHPAGWGPTRRRVLVEAAVHAGLPAPTLVPEPVAAAAYFTTLLGHQVPPGSQVVVYDLGAGTLDVSVVARGADGFEVRGIGGQDDFGGIDLDALLVERVAAVIERHDPAARRRLESPASPEERRAFRTLWDDARAAKEILSRQTSATLYAPFVDQEVLVGREEFERLAQPRLLATAQLTVDVMRTAGVAPAQLAGLFLVGGASRVPLVATTLHRVGGIAPVVLEQPEIVVAHGALVAPTGPSTMDDPAEPTAPPEPASPPPPGGPPSSPGSPSPGSPPVKRPASPRAALADSFTGTGDRGGAGRTPPAVRWVTVAAAALAMLVGFFGLPWIRTYTGQGHVDVGYLEVAAHAGTGLPSEPLDLWRYLYAHWLGLLLAAAAMAIAVVTIAAAGNGPGRPPRWTLLSSVVLVALAFLAFMAMPSPPAIGSAPGLGSLVSAGGYLLLALASPARSAKQDARAPRA
ncbi:Hsp70 family protein [Micromonospora sp. NPDC049559]|uniref:Hsp70 family protein n=1 Tax=Micromonospora sp. NPDC049559 TaxID=3155923 RepID=UPI003445692E